MQLDAEVLKQLKIEVESTPIITEGIKDKIPLAKLGFNNIVTISGKSLVDVVDRMKGCESVIILTDYDEEGEWNAKVLAKLFGHVGVKTSMRLRKKFRSVFGVVKIEEINSMIKEDF